MYDKHTHTCKHIGILHIQILHVSTYNYYSILISNIKDKLKMNLKYFMNFSPGVHIQNAAKNEFDTLQNFTIDFSVLYIIHELYGVIYDVYNSRCDIYYDGVN